MAPSADVELLWDQLLQFIEEESVIAVVGPELVQLSIEGRQVPLYRHLAERLAPRLGVSAEGLTDASPLHEVACRHLQQGGDLQYVYSSLSSILKSYDDPQLPEPLLELAAIRPIQLYVSTTFDPFLARALDKVRFGGQSTTAVYSYSPDDAQDIPGPVEASGRPAVYHLFGKVSAYPRYAVTEEDMLEFVHSLQSEARRPRLLFGELTRKNLLVLGGGFPDWLVRFIIRIAKQGRLTASGSGKTDIMADAGLRDNSGLILFLKYFGGRTKIFPGGAVEFVHELHQRWSARQPVAVPEPPARPAAPAAAGGLEKGSIFLSYASEDRAVAQALKEQLEAADLDVWFDRDDLEGGDRFGPEIKSKIQHCSVFVPLLSRHVLTPEPRFFRKEWDYAIEIAGQLPETRAFIVPVAIDDIPPTAGEVREKFREIHWQRLEGARASAALVETLSKLYRSYQRSLSRGAAA